MTHELQNVLYSEIPLTRSIGIIVEEHTGSSLTLAAPLENNINHKCTAFGGSLYSVSVLSGWGLLYLLLKQHNLTGHIVIQESNIKYIKPVTSNFSATCAFESEIQTNKFIRTFKRKEKARIALESRIRCHGELSVLFLGSYVVHT